MSAALFLGVLTAGAAAGAGCGVSCSACSSPMVNLYVASYLFTCGNRLRHTMLALCQYYLGKTVSVTALCLVASLLGSRLMDENGFLGSVDMRIVLQILLILVVVVEIIQWFRKEKAGADSVGCKSCGMRQYEKYPMVIYGVLSGIAPCAPLFLILTYTAGITPLMAVAAGAAFAIANSLLPVIALSILTGALSAKMREEIPGKIKYLQLGTYAVFLVIAGAGLIRII